MSEPWTVAEAVNRHIMVRDILGLATAGPVCDEDGQEWPCDFARMLDLRNEAAARDPGPRQGAEAAPSTGAGLREALEVALPFALAEADDAGSVPDDWTGSEYVDRMAAELSNALGSRVCNRPEDHAPSTGAGHRLLMPPHPADVYRTSALCSCGEWQYDYESAIAPPYRDILAGHTEHASQPLTGSRDGLDVERLTTVLYDWMPDGADVSVGFDGDTAHLTGSDLALFIFARAAEYAALASDTGTGPVSDHPFKDEWSFQRRMASTGAGLPIGTRLILASENLLGQFGTRTEDGYRITAEWGDQKPEGWYEPVFTVHYDEPVATLEVPDREAAADPPGGRDKVRAFADEHEALGRRIISRYDAVRCVTVIEAHPPLVAAPRSGPDPTAIPRDVSAVERGSSGQGSSEAPRRLGGP